MTQPAEREESFAVFYSGEQIEGTDIGMTYIQVKTPLGKLRMTAEEADNLGQALRAAARLARDAEEAEGGAR